MNRVKQGKKAKNFISQEMTARDLHELPPLATIICKMNDEEAPLFAT
jgi:hypothetical protein